MAYSWKDNLPDGGALPENTDIAPLATLTADDGGTDAVSYSISTDLYGNLLFTIDDNGVLSPTDYLKDYENSLLDYASESRHFSAIVNAHGADGTVLTRLFVLTLQDVDEPTEWVGTPFAGGSIAENNPENYGPVVFNAVDGDAVAVTYSLSGGDVDYFSLNATTGEFYLKSSLDFEDTDHGVIYSVTVNATSTDGSTTISQAVIVTVTDVNEGVEWQTTHTGNAGEVLENLAVGTSVADFSSTDTEGTATAYYGLGASYGIGGGHQDDYFNIGFTTGIITTKSLLDFEEFTHYTLNVLSQAGDKDIGVDVISHIFILTIADVSEPTEWVSSRFAGGNVAENNPENYGPIVFNATDGDAVAVTYSLSGDDADYFNLDANTGGLYLKSSLDYEDTDHGIFYSVTVNATSTDGSPSISQTVIVTVTDVVNERVAWETTPTGNAGEVLENIAIGTSVANFSATDPEGAADALYGLGAYFPDFGLAGGSQGQYFNIDQDTGVLTTKSELDYETFTHYTIRVLSQADDMPLGTGVIGHTFILTIGDVNDNPTTWENNGNPVGNTISENLASGTSLADFNATDGDNVGVTYSVASNLGDGSYFAIDSTTGILTTTSSFNFETPANATNRYSVLVRANSLDDSPQIQQVFVLTITDVAEDIFWVQEPGSLNLAENNTAGGLLDVFSAGDEDIADNVSYSITDAFDDAYFSINSDTGQLYATSSFDFEDPNHDNSYTILITAHSTGGGAYSSYFYLNITDVDGAGLAPDPTTPDQPVGINGKILFDGTTETIGGINDGIGNDGLVIIGNDLTTTQYDSVSATNTDLIITNAENFEQSFVGYTDADGNEQNHWFFVRDDAGDNTGHIVFDADGLDVNLESLANGGATTTPDQINLLAGLNFGNDGDFAKPDDFNLDLNGNNAAALTHDQFLALIGGSNNIDFI